MLCSLTYNAHKDPKAAMLHPADFLRMPAEDLERRKLENLAQAAAILSAVGTTKPPGYHRKRSRSRD